MPDTPSAGSAARPDRVLVAEDNVINQRVAVAMLRHLGFAVDVVANGADAVQAAATLTPYRAILMDCQIPGLDGYQATGEIRRRQGSSRHTPIIAVTGSATSADRQRCLSAGMDDYLAKPLRLKPLADVMGRWAPRRSRARIADDEKEIVLTSDVDAGDQTEPGRTVLDAKIVARLERLGAATGEDLIGQLAAMFLAEAVARIGALRLALAEDDPAAVSRCAHTLSGASANLGATELARMCAALARGGADPADRGAQLDGIEAELGRVRSALRALVPAA